MRLQATAWIAFLVVVTAVPAERYDRAHEGRVALRPPSARTTCNGKEFKMFILCKFHKVGGTTVAIMLEKITREMDWDTSRQKVALLSHWTLNWFTYSHEKKYPPLKLLRARFPNPLIVVVLRDPVEKLLSRIYFEAARVQKSISEDIISAMLFQEENISREHRAEYVRILGNGSLDRAMYVLKKIDAVGITEELSGVMVQIARLLCLPVERMIYKSAKVVEGRPSFQNLSAPIREAVSAEESRARVHTMDRPALHEVSSLLMLTCPSPRPCANQVMTRVWEDGGLDVKLWRHAKEIAQERIASMDAEDDVKRLDAMIAKTYGHGCDTSVHGGSNLLGSWCYKYGSNSQAQ